MLAINLRHLFFFVEVTEQGSITAAADSVHLSQPAITQAVANAEMFFATPLLVRARTGVTLTAAGKLAQQRLQRAFLQLQEGITELTKSAIAQEWLAIFRSRSTAQVEALLAVIEHRTVSAASLVKGVSQPTIHRATRNLGHLLNTQLFEKTSYGVVPTRDAELFARKVRLAFAEIAQAQAEVNALHGGETGRSVIGALPLARTFLLPNALMKFAEQFPNHQIELVEGTYGHLLGGLRSGEIDFFIGAMRESESVADVVEKHLFDDPLSIVMRSHHPLARKRHVTVSMLSKFQWVAPRSGSPLRNHYNKLFKSAGVIPPAASIECNSVSAARALLLESDRIMLLSEHQIYYELRAGLLKALPPPGGAIDRQIGITYRRDWKPTKAQETLLSILKSKHLTATGLSMHGVSHLLVTPCTNKMTLLIFEQQRRKLTQAASPGQKLMSSIRRYIHHIVDSGRLQCNYIGSGITKKTAHMFVFQFATAKTNKGQLNLLLESRRGLHIIHRVMSLH